MTRKQEVTASFSAAATTYDQAAAAQAAAADRLVELVMEHPCGPRPNVLEVGCGTGLLTRRLQPRLGGQWLITDLSPGMITQATSNLAETGASFRVMDAENPDVPTGLYDLVVSNMAAQWFSDLGRAVRRLLACLTPGGLLAFSTLGHDSFAQWRAAHERLGLACGVPLYPDAEQLAAILPAQARIVRQVVEVRHADAFDFVESLKQIGADTPLPGYVPLKPGALRKVMRGLGAPVSITYDILHVLIVAE